MTSDSDSDLETVSSQPLPSTSFEVVPEDRRFKFKMFKNSWGKGDMDLIAKFGFDLKKGKKLPYTADLKGKGNITFFKMMFFFQIRIQVYVLPGTCRKC